MFLAVDVGNTQSTMALFDDEGAVCQHWRMKTERADTVDELHARIRSFFAMRGVELASVRDAAVASVVPVLQELWRSTLAEVMGTEPLVVSATGGCGMPIAMPHPEQVGADRIANAVEALATYGAPSIVVDFGTATNIDVVDGEGRFRGGAIAPGLSLSASALFSRAAKLASVPLEVPEHALGDSTEHAVQSGLVIGVAAQAEGLVARIRRELAEEATDEAGRTAALECPVIATGGLSRTIAKATDLFDAIDADLTLRGIRRIYLKERA